ncbi:MAG: ATP-dependent DNA helicase RecG [Alphaproteobacteria bacterium]|nr:ATP-dependent DNA helicase RecG [Alphaproteobacteria bacterium]
MLLSPLSSLRGVGPSLTKSLTKLVGQNKIFSLLLHKPVRIESIAFCPRLFEVQNDQLIAIKLKVESHIKPQTNRQPYKIICYNPTGYVSLSFFKIFPSQISKMQIGREIAVLGHLQRFSSENQITHPQEILPANRINELPKQNVVYPLIAGITQNFLRKKISEILAKLPAGKLCEALKILHYQQEGDAESARKYLASKELLAWQIAVSLAKKSSKNKKPWALNTSHSALNFFSSLPFQPTSAQLRATSEIESEIFSDKKMLRLLQGDVGSGKTIVAIAACLATISQNRQVCLIAPTTVLAKQHLAYFQRFLHDYNIKTTLLTSATTKRQKAKILTELVEGKINILISTHAALEDDIKFQNLGLAIIDEQHRFGVMQRLKLVEKGADVDLLLMSATPIPRSLMMALYGDIDISILDEKPRNRQKIETLIMSANKTDEVHEAIKRAVLREEKIYWICPVINWDDEMELVAAKEKYAELSKIFGTEKTGLLHGKMSEKEKEKVMNEFVHGTLQIMVATTVIEVGIDVPDATIILIENAENFGLSQLHQLRGRVGRLDKKSFCILLYGERIGANGRARLNILRQSDDGFVIAEEDLKMRGSGDLLGTKQSGFPEFKIADLACDVDLLASARNEARLILQQDLGLKERKHQLLLQLFDYDECLRTYS